MSRNQTPRQARFADIDRLEAKLIASYKPGQRSATLIALASLYFAQYEKAVARANKEWSSDVDDVAYQAHIAKQLTNLADAKKALAAYKAPAKSTVKSRRERFNVVDRVNLTRQAIVRSLVLAFGRKGFKSAATVRLAA